MGVESLPAAEPVRLTRDLADAEACRNATDSFIHRATKGSARLPPEISDKIRQQVRSAVARSSFPACRIENRECWEAKDGRRWCWASAVLDTADIRMTLEQVLKVVDSSRSEVWSRIILEP